MVFSQKLMNLEKYGWLGIEIWILGVINKDWPGGGELTLVSGAGGGSTKSFSLALQKKQTKKNVFVFYVKH